MASRTSVLSLVRRAIPAIAGKPGQANLRLKVTALAVVNGRHLAGFVSDPSPSLQRIMGERPELIVGPLVWPYLCSSWDIPERLDRVVAHYRALDRLGPPFPFAVTDKLILAELDAIHPGLRIVLDQPRWFMREGGLTLNIFAGDFRAYSLAFSLGESKDGTLYALIGSIQGRNTENAPELYRDLTKAALGVRPRDLLIEVCRMYCRHWGVQTLLAVRDARRHHHHPFFAGKTIAPQDYDAIWQDRGGVEHDAEFYRLPIAPDRRRDDEIKPNKRSMYRRRYQFLDELERDLIRALPELSPVNFRDT